VAAQACHHRPAAAQALSRRGAWPASSDRCSTLVGQRARALIALSRLYFALTPAALPRGQQYLLGLARRHRVTPSIAVAGSAPGAAPTSARPCGRHRAAGRAPRWSPAGEVRSRVPSRLPSCRRQRLAPDRAARHARLQGPGDQSAELHGIPSPAGWTADCRPGKNCGRANAQSRSSVHTGAGVSVAQLARRSRCHSDPSARTCRVGQHTVRDVDEMLRRQSVSQRHRAVVGPGWDIALLSVELGGPHGASVALRHLQGKAKKFNRVGLEEATLGPGTSRGAGIGGTPLG
jgi:hypothetical protein